MTALIWNKIFDVLFKKSHCDNNKKPTFEECKEKNSIPTFNSCKKKSSNCKLYSIHFCVENRIAGYENLLCVSKTCKNTFFKERKITIVFSYLYPPLSAANIRLFIQYYRALEAELSCELRNLKKSASLVIFADFLCFLCSLLYGLQGV